MKTTLIASSVTKWIVLGFLLSVIVALSFMKSPEAIKTMLEGISMDVRFYSVFTHILFLAVIGVGMFSVKGRVLLFPLFLAFLSLSATVVSIRYAIAPNILMFAMIFGLTLFAYFTKNLHFPTKSIAPADLLFGILGLAFGFWYLHWVANPVWLNALLFSPLGAVNCPTRLTICGFLCLSQEPRSALLEVAVGLMTLFFGFFGIFRLGAYIDVVLIICALYLIVRCSSPLFHMSPRTPQDR